MIPSEVSMTSCSTAGHMDFLYLMDLLHHASVPAAGNALAAAVKRACKSLWRYTKAQTFDTEKFRTAFHTPERNAHTAPHLAVLGARMGQELFEMTKQGYAASRRE